MFISSLSGKFASAGASIYNATKFGLRGFGFALHEELRGTGVGVTTVFPGFIRDAGMFADANVELPRCRQPPPEDVARAVLAGIDKGRAEVDVAPRSLAFGARMFGLAPRTMAGLNRRLGSDPLTEAIAAGQRDSADVHRENYAVAAAGSRANSAISFASRSGWSSDTYV